MTSILKKKQEEGATIEFIEECIRDYEKLADEHDKMAKEYRRISNFWKKRYNEERTHTGSLAPLFVDDVKVETIKKVTFK